MTDSKSAFLNGMGVSEQQIKDGKLPDLMVKGEKPNRIRLAFRNKFDPPVTFADFTMVTVSADDFDRICKSLPKTWADMLAQK